MIALYENSKHFREYVDRYCKARGIELHEALTHKLIISVGNYYKGVQDDKRTQNS